MDCLSLMGGQFGLLENQRANKHCGQNMTFKCVDLLELGALCYAVFKSNVSTAQCVM
jgi:hypothetical protein